jgi:hypothetical protein
VSGITMAPSSLTVEMGGTGIFTATVSPPGATNKRVVWTSGNTAIATVDSTGKVTGVAVGTTRMTATTADGGKTAQGDVTVLSNVVGVASVALSPSSLSLVQGTKGTFTAVGSPANATNKGVTWATDNPAVATVLNGSVTAVAIGTAHITVLTDDGGHPAQATVTVTAPPVYAEENPFPAFLAALGTNPPSPVQVINAGPMVERAWVFTPTATGTINAVTLRLPRDTVNVRMTIWDVATATALKTIIIPSITGGGTVTQSLDVPLPLTKNKQYALSYNSIFYYERQPSGTGKFPYPFTTGNIRIDEYRHSDSFGQGSSAQVFPDASHIFNNSYHGDFSFVFLRTQ